MQLEPRSSLFRHSSRHAGYGHRTSCRGEISTAVALSSPAPLPVIPILAVTQQCQSYQELQSIFGAAEWSLYTKSPVNLRRAGSFAGARACLQSERFPVVIIDIDGIEGSWQVMTAFSAGQNSPPALIISSRLADERLWAEAFNLGVYDVLSKPFQQDQVVRTVGLAWLHWRDQEYLKTNGKDFPVAKPFAAGA